LDAIVMALGCDASIGSWSEDCADTSGEEEPLAWLGDDAVADTWVVEGSAPAGGSPRMKSP
jgi:hypothetical protein